MTAQLLRAVGVIGAGQMGAGIAQVAASAGLSVWLVDRSEGQLRKAKDSIQSSLSRLAAKGALAEAPAAVHARLATATDLGALHACDWIIEAVPEDETLKRAVLAAADAVAPPHAVLASNTSSLSITRLAAATARPASVVGLHFMNPVPLMSLVEVVRGLGTSDATFGAALALAARLGKRTCVAADRPGFLVNRLLMPQINEAFFALMEGVGSAEDIDAGMRLGANHPMGPLSLADLIGLDTCLAVMRVLHSGIGDDKYRPCPLLVQHVDAGWLGRKAGRGVYVYS
jgi:3-hydroxybutyryl-CoA dehydrogenase